MRTIKESIAALHIQRRHKTDKDDWTKTIFARPSGVGHRDLGLTLLGQGVFGTAELRHITLCGFFFIWDPNFGFKMSGSHPNLLFCYNQDTSSPFR